MADGLAIADYGMGNLRSVQKAFEKLGAAAIVTDDPNRLAEAARIVLPGVGAFKDAIRSLRERGLDEPILAHLRQDRPFLGICLGLQMLFERSLEDGEHSGLAVLPGEIVRFPAGTPDKVPHMGWNVVESAQDSGTFGFLPQPAWVYFVHSYFAVPRGDGLTALTCEHAGLRFCAALARGRLWATQFHPEKSQKVGLSILHTFLTLC